MTVPDCNEVATIDPEDKSRSSGALTGDRDALGRWRPGNEGAHKHGVRAYEATCAAPEDVLDGAKAFAAALEDDAAQALGAAYKRRLPRLEVVLELLERDIEDRGVMTVRGRPRAAFRTYLTTVATWDRMAGRLAQLMASTSADAGLARLFETPMVNVVEQHVEDVPGGE